MKISLSKGYFVTIFDDLLGYVGEHRARKIIFDGLSCEGAEAYKMRLEYPDGKSYEVDITSGEYLVDGSLLPEPCEVKAQIFAYAVEGDSYKLVKKSNIFTLKICESLSGEPAPIPTYEQAVEALERINRFSGIDAATEEEVNEMLDDVFADTSA